MEKAGAMKTEDSKTMQGCPGQIFILHQEEQGVKREGFLQANIKQYLIINHKYNFFSCQIKWHLL